LGADSLRSDWVKEVLRGFENDENFADSLG
jgi:hypothetical protein